MNRVVLSTGMAILLSLARPAAALDADAQCRQWAQEDGIPAAELEEYVASCVDELTSAAPDNPADVPQGEENDAGVPPPDDPQR